MSLDLISAIQAVATVLQAASQMVPISQFSLAAGLLFMVGRSLNPNDVQTP
jgi:hypothetical protein